MILHLLITIFSSTFIQWLLSWSFFHSFPVTTLTLCDFIFWHSPYTTFLPLPPTTVVSISSNNNLLQISSYVGDKTQFFGPEDSISLSLEYYQAHLDLTDVEGKPKAHSPKTVGDTSSSTHSDSAQTQIKQKTDDSDLTNVNSDSDCTKDREQVCRNSDNGNGKSDSDRDVKSPGGECDKRFLQCPPAVSMKHLQKFLRMKFGLTGDHRVSEEKRFNNAGRWTRDVWWIGELLVWRHKFSALALLCHRNTFRMFLTQATAQVKFIYVTFQKWEMNSCRSWTRSLLLLYFNDQLAFADIIATTGRLKKNRLVTFSHEFYFFNCPTWTC